MVTRSWRERLIALQNANCTTVGGEFDFGEAHPDGAKESMSELRCRVPDAMRIGLEESRGLIVHCAEAGFRLEVEGIVAGEADFDSALAALHGVKAGAYEISIKKNISRRCEKAHVGERRLKDLSAAADGFEIEFAGALGADKRAAGRSNDDVAGDFLEMNIAGDAFESHVAHDLLDIDQARFAGELQFGFFGHRELQAGGKFHGWCGGIANASGDVNAVTGLFHIKTDFVGGLAGEDVHFGVFPGLHFNAAIGDIVDYDDGTALDGEMFFDVLFGSGGVQARAEKSRGREYGQNTALQA